MKKERKNPIQKSPEILIVEDSLTQATQIRHLLESHNYKVSVAQNGKQAMDRLPKHKPSLVISDILMPEMNGYELCKNIKSNKSTEDIPVILLTRLVDPEEIIEGLTCGADCFITKPFNEKYLLSQIEKIISKEIAADHKKVPFSTQIFFKGKERFIQAEQQNVIRLMLDIYEGAIHQNERLVKTEEELRLLNEQLESLVEDRTSDLYEEIKLSNQIANRLKESEEKYRRIFENHAAVKLLIDPDSGNIIDANKSAADYYGWSCEELKRMKIDQINTLTPDEVKKELDKVVSQKRIHFEFRHQRKDGSIRDVDVFSSTIKIGNKNVLHSIIHDITERKQAEEALQKSQHLFETLAQVSPVGIFRTDPDGNTIYMNPKWIELSGLTTEEGLGLGWLKAVHPDDREKLVKKWNSDLQSQKTSIAEYRFIRPDGSIVWVTGNAVPELTDNEIVGYIGTITDITGRKQAEEVLRESESSLRDAQEIAKMGSWEWDMVTQKTNWSDNYFTILGFKSKEVEPDFGLFRSRIHPDDFHFLDELHAKIIRDKTPSSHELRLIQIDGTVKWIQNYISPVIEDDKLVKLKGVIIDITERKLAEDKLRSSEERLKILFDYAPDAYYLNDLKGNFIDGNIAAEKLMGYNRNELIGKSFLKLKLLSIKQLPRAAKLLVKNSLGQGTGPDEFVLSRRDGSKVTVEIVTHPVKIENKTLVLGLARDVTERKRMEEAMQIKDWAIESAINSIVTSDIEGNLNYVNPAFLKLWGYNSREEVLGKPAIGFWQMGEKVAEVMEAVRTKGGWIGELVAKSKDGDFFDVQVAASIVINDTGQPVCMLASFADITERKLTEKTLKLAKEKAEASDRLKTTFLNNISHEVRTPLNGILGFADIMSQADLSEEEKKMSLSMLFESSDRLLNTITNYMDISLITSGTMVVNKKDFMPEKIMRDLLKNYLSECSGRKFELLLKLPEHSDELSINSDPEILSKVVSHLLSNAIKFTEEGSIQYGYTIGKNELEFFVKDTGIGIDKESLKDVFVEFIKEDRGPIKITEGSGLGLSISKGLVELLGGKIWVESEKGKGSDFFFTIPIIKENKIDHFVIREDSQNKNKVIKSILVAEDDEINFFYLKALLKQNTSADIIHASNGREAIDKFEENPDIGLVLMDIKMPVMDGLEATRQIKAINRNIPIIAITAYAMPGDENRITEAGCDYYLVKPINKKLLLEKMVEYIVL